MHSAKQHKPDVVVFDNLAQVITAEYSKADRVHRLIVFAYQLAREHNAAIIFPAHPKKMDEEFSVSLENDPERYVEQIMGTSHFINSTGSIWALERRQAKGHSVFMGGRQRGDGHWGHCFIDLDDSQWFQVLDDLAIQLESVVNTEQRRKAWNLLPVPPQTFGYNEGERMDKPAMRSSSTYAAWMQNLRRVRAVLDADEKLCKAVGGQL
jgi:hypothetical protein